MAMNVKLSAKCRYALPAALFLVMGLSAYAFGPDEKTVPEKPAAQPEAKAAAVQKVSAEQFNVAQLAEKSGIKVEWHSRLGTPLSIRGPKLGERRSYSGGKGLALKGGGHYERDAIAVLDNLARFYRLQDAEKEFAAKPAEPDSLGFHHVRLKQVYQGLRVFGGDLVVHFDKNGQAYQVNGQYVPDIQVEAVPKIDAAEAVRIAQRDLAGMGKPEGDLEEGPTLVIFARDTEPQLAYELTLSYADPKAGLGRWRYWVDALQGKVLFRYNDIQKIAAPTTNGTNAIITGSILVGEGGSVSSVTGWHENTGYYYLYNTNRSWYAYNRATTGYPDYNTYAYRSTADWGTSDRVEMSGARNFDLVQRYYREVHGRNSFNNAGAYAQANVHYGTSYVNAFWDGSALWFGDGDGVTANSLAVLDVCGHEYTHAVDQYTANLTYAGESGALNESFSDIFGACIEFWAEPDGRANYPGKVAGTADWLCGEDCWLSSVALRDLRNPANTATVGVGNQQPTRYQGTYWDPSGEVHQNDGVQNFFFYLLSEGGSGNNDGILYNVTGIGETNAEKVAYRALTVYCTPSTGYRAVRGAWFSAAMDLNPSWAASAGAAWSAVGINALSMTPDGAVSFRGPVGGPFTPLTQTYTLINQGAVSMNWSVTHTQAWMDVTPTNGIIPANGSNMVSLSINAAANGLATGVYADGLAFSNSIDSAIQVRQVNLLVGQLDYFTELFDTSANDLAFQTFTFTPDGSANFYAVCREVATNFPTDPTGGTAVTMGDDTYAQATLSGTNTVAIYGRRTNVFYIGSNGYLTMDSGDSVYAESFTAHFNRPRVSALFDDLYPSTGQVTWMQMSNRVAVTYLNVPEYGATTLNSFQIEMFYDGRIRLTYLGLAALDGLAGLSAGLGVPAGFAESDFSSYGSCSLPLFVVVPSSATEGDGVLAGAGQVRLLAAPTTNLTVALSSGDATEVTVPASVTVLAGQTNAAFDLTVVDDAELDGTQTAAITASASGYNTSSANLAVFDNETATLGVVLPATATEGQATAPGTVQISAVPAANIVVGLSSSDTTEIQVPASVIIPSGQTSAVFTATVVDDNQIDGPQAATVTAHVQNWTDGSAIITVLDNENTNLTVTLPAQAREGDGVLTNAGSVSISGTLPTNLVVMLVSDDTTELVVPPAVTILAGQTSGLFNLTVVDDPDLDGAQIVQVTASAGGFADGSRAMTIYDDESPPVPSNPSPAHLATNVIQTTGLSWQSGAMPGEVITNDVYFGTNPTPGPGELLGTTTNTSWTLPVLAPQTTYYWQVVARKTGTTAGPVWQFTTRGVNHFDLSFVSSPQYVNSPFTLTVTARDAFDAVVSNFTGTVGLRGSSGSNATALFGDDFEDGDFSGWNIGSGSYIRAVTNQTAAGGNYSFTLIGGNFTHGDGISYSLSNLTPANITFYVRASATNVAGGYFIIGTNIMQNSDIAVWFYMRDDGMMGINEDVSGWHGVPYVANQWYKISLLMDWVNRRVGYFVDDTLAFTNIPFRGSGISSLTRVYLYNYNNTQAWWDEIMFSGGNVPAPVSISPTNSGTFTNGAWTGNITVLQSATNVVLRAADGNGHTGSSNPFEVVPADMPPVILAQPADQTVVRGGTTAFTVVVDGTPPLSYQWNFNGTNIDGATDATLTLTNVQLAQAGNYAVVVTNVYGSVTGSNATLTVYVAPTIISFSPASGSMGTVVTINGNGFGPVPGSNVVYFGAVRAAVTAASVTNLTVTLPVGATYAPITVTVNGLTAYANQPFMPTFSGDGSGITVNSFAPRLDLASGSGPNKVVIADLDGDGEPDLVVANDYNNSISLYRNISTNGSLTAGSFAPRVDLATPPGSYSPFGLAVADVDGDGRLDIVVSDYDESIVSVYRNTCTPGNISSNAFATRVDFATGAQPLGVEVRDLDGDGKPDLLVANSGDGTVSILRNTGVMGSLTTNSFAPKVDMATGSGCEGVAVGDLDGDGKPDVVTANYGNDTVSLLRNISPPGSITTNSFAATVDIAVLSGPVQVAIGDLDGDGKPDLTVAFYLPQTVSVLRNTSTVGSLTTDSFAPRIDFSLGGRGHTPAIADLDGDGIPDLAVVTELNSLLSIFRNVSTPGSFTNSSFASRVDFSAGYNAWGVTIGDLDGDGRPDIVFCNSYDSTISIYQNVTPFGGPPNITSQPTNQTVAVGGTATFSVTAVGALPLSHQWSFNGTNMSGATNTSLVLTNVQLSQAGNYAVLVTNAFGSILSSNAVLTVSPPCTATPSNLVAWWPGEGNANDIIGTNNGALRSGVGFASGEVGQGFQLNNTNAFITVPASPTLNVGTNSGFTLETWICPTNVNIYPPHPIFEWNQGFSGGGAGVHLWIDHASGYLFANVMDTGNNSHEMWSTTSVIVTNQFQHVALTYDRASGTARLYANGVIVGQANMGSFTPQTSYNLYIGRRPSDHPGDSTYGNFFGGIIDEPSIYNRALSSNEIAAIYNAGNGGKCPPPPTPPSIMTQPTNQTVVVGGTATFTVMAGGTPPLGYQWYFNWTDLVAGATNSSLTLTNVQISQAGSYAVLVTNPYGSVFSTNAVLTVNTSGPPVILSQPANQAVLAGDSAAFSVVAGGTPPLRYQWRFNGTNLSGATNTWLTLTNVQLSQAGNYTVRVTNVLGLVISSNAVLTVLAPPTITTQPASQAVAVGGTAIFSVTAGGTPPLSCQWNFNGTNISGATNTSLTLANVQLSQAGNYAVLVANAYGTIGSSNATLIVAHSLVVAWGDNTYGQTNVPLNLTNVTAIVAGGYHSLVLKDDGTVVAWGRNNNGQTTVPPALTSVAAIAAGGYHSLVLESNGVVVAWGNNGFGQANVPAGLTGVTAVAAGGYHSLALESNGVVVAWGDNHFGQTNVPSNLTNAAAIAAGGFHSLALRSDGTVVAWGYNNSGQASVPPGLSNVVAVAAGALHSLALRSDGKVVAWGYNFYGQTNVPPDLTNVVAIDGGEYHSLALKADGRVVAWGDNTYGQTNGTAGLSNVVAISAGWYHDLAYVKNEPPVILTQSVSQTVIVGSNTTFAATAGGSLPLNYQWYFNGASLADDARHTGTTTGSLNIANVQTNDEGGYQLVVTNVFGAVTSSVASLTVLVPPTFTLQPVSQTAFAGSNAMFAATADGTPPLGYQWYFNGAPLAEDARHSGTTTCLLNISNVQTNDAGDYQVVVTNIAGAVTSSVASLTVLVPPTFTLQPVSQTAIAGSNATFTAAADGTPPLNYQWYFNGATLADDARHSGTATSSLSISNVLTSDAGNYTVTVTNLAGSVSSTAAVLTVLSPPTITTQPVGRSVPLGLPASFSASATGDSPLSYQWQLNGTNIPGATDTTYAISAAGTNDFGVYHLVVSNAVGVVTSADALLTWGQIVAWGNNGSGQTVVPPYMTNVVMVAGGGAGGFGGHSLALRADGTVVAWGYHDFGQTDVPANATNVVAVAAGGAHSLALRDNGKVIAWGENLSGQTNVPPTLSNVVAIAAGSAHSLALRADGKVLAWGDNGAGQTTVPASMPKVVAIGAGAFHSLAVCSDGTIVAWGLNNYGQTNVPLNATNVIAVAGGHQNSLALRVNGTVLSWGTNSVVTSLTNVIAGLTNATGIGAGDNYYAALRADGTVLVWGNNTFGQTNVPAGVSNAVAIAAGGVHVLALIGDGRPMITRQPVGGTTYVGRDFALSAAVAGAAPLGCQWQFNGADIPNATNTTLVLSNLALTNAGNYQLIVSNALGVAASVPAPLTVLNNNALSFWSQPVTQTNYQASKIMLGVSVLGNGPLRYQWYWSATNTGYVPVGGATNDTLTLDPALAIHSGNYYVVVSNQVTYATSQTAYLRVLFAKSWGYLATDPPFNLTNAVAVAVGNAGSGTSAGHYLALRSDGKVSAWGTSYYGETNTAALSNSFVTAIAAGYEDSLALRSDGTVYAWGYGYYGQTNVPSGLNSVVAIACGYQHDLALKSDGTVVGWGYNNYGQVTNYPAATNVIAIAAGYNHSLALRADGTVVGWGYNGYGQTTIPSAASNVIAIAAGDMHNLALRADGTVISWGYLSTVPTGLSNVVAIAAGYMHSTALRSDGTVVSWGSYYIGTAAAPSDLANVVQIASSSDHDVGLFGTRAPYITIQPVSRTVFKGTTNVLLAAKAAGVQPVGYQWQFNGVNLSGATNDTLTLTNLQFSQAGAYRLVAGNSYGVVSSKPAKLVVTIPLGEALDATNRVWTTSGNAPWYGQTNTTHDGVDAARSGDIGNIQETILQTTLVTNWSGRCIFWWKVSSEEYFDTLEFRVNGVAQTNISGEVDWQQCSVPVPAGTNVLQWRYSKDATYGSGQDAGWVDQFSFRVDPPVITAQPTNLAVSWGTTAQFRVTATNYPPLAYRWWRNGTTPVGNNTSILTLTGVQDADAASYTVVVTNVGGSVTSSPAILTVIDWPIITSQPASRTNVAGTTATFSVAAIGKLPFSYQWRKDGVDMADGGNVSGSTTTSLVLSNVQDADAAGYTVVVTNVAGSVTSSPALLTVLDSAPTITSQPLSCTNLGGTTAAFAVAASGTTPFSYQWQFNGTNLDGAINSLLTLDNVRAVNAGPYQVVVTNAWGSVTSSIATLTVVRSMVVAWGNNSYGQTNVPLGLVDVVAIAGGSYHNLALQADGTVVAWGKNDYGQTNVPPGLTNAVAIAGGTYHSLALQANGTVVAWGDNDDGETNVPAGLTNVVAIAAGGYNSLALQANGTMVVWGWNGYGQTNVPAGLTNVVAIAAGIDHSLALQANGTVVAWGCNDAGETNVPVDLTNVVAIAGGGEHSLALQADGTVVAWGENLYGETNVPAGLTDVVAIAAGYWHNLLRRADGTVVAWGGYNSYGETNVPAGLTNVVAIAGGDYHSLALENDGSPFIVRQPWNQTTPTNTTVVFSVTALGQSPLNYQWRKNGSNLTDGGNVSGSTTASLTLTNVQNADAAGYTVVITNAIDCVTSSPAMLVVMGPPEITLQPVNQTVNMGTNVQFSVTAIGYPVPAYQWWWNGTNPVGVNSSNLSLLSVGRAHNGVYSVMVTNTIGGILSSNATLKVLVPQRLGTPVLLPDGTLQLTSGDADGGLLLASDLANFEAQMSTNLMDWVTLTNALSLTNGMLQLQDPSSTNDPMRFYRLIEH
jgi:alpha-tubulin suppressor-like RCC1 family protein/Zn-dependent metalloprotease